MIEPWKIWRGAVLASVSAIALAACSGGGQDVATAAAESKQACTGKVWSELDNADIIFMRPRFHDRELAIEACEKMTREYASDADGFEALGIIYSLPIDDSQTRPSDLTLAMENFRKAEALGSTYASYAIAKMMLAEQNGGDAAVTQLDTALQALEPEMAAGSLSAKTLYVDLALRAPGAFADTDRLKSNGVFSKVNEIAAAKADFLYEYYAAIAQEGLCAEYLHSTPEGVPLPPRAHVMTCHDILDAAAKAGSVDANLSLGVMHVQIARVIAEERGSGWERNVGFETKYAREYLQFAQAHGSGETAELSGQLIEKMDRIVYARAPDMGSGGAGVGLFLAGLLALAVVGGGDSDEGSDVYGDAVRRNEQMASDEQHRQFELWMEHNR